MTKCPDTRCFIDPEDRSMPDFAIGNASSWPEIDLSLLDTGRGTAGAPVDYVGSGPAGGRPANRWRINPAGLGAGRGAAEIAES
jgi:hypothetical protein